MDFNLEQNLQYCKVIVDQFRSLLYYSHIPTAVLGLLVGIYVAYKSRTLLSRLLLYITIVFAIWTTLDLLIWINYDKASIVMFAWAPIEIFSVLLFMLCLYFFDVFCDGKDIGFGRKAFFSLLFLPMIIAAPLTYYLKGYDLQECVAIEDPFYLKYVLYFKIILALYILVVAVLKYRKATKEMRPQIVLLATGIVGFIACFFVAGEISEYTQNYTYEMYGLFGITIFIGFLAFLIIRFRAFRIRMFGAQVLVLTLVALVASQYAFIVNPISKVLNGVTLGLVAAFGFILVRSVKAEIQVREHAEALAYDLQLANDKLVLLDKQKSEFVSFASHQLRSPLTAMKGYASLILEGDYGAIDPEVRVAVDRIYDSSSTLANVVDDYLNISRIELGTMKYNFVELDWKAMVQSVINELHPNIERAGLSVVFATDPGASYMIMADPDKFKQVIANIIDNSVKYTPHGSINVALEKGTVSGKIIFSVKDTGIGMSKETIPKLFSKFIRANNANETNIRGTGLGLYVAKEIVFAHKGRIWAESEGEGKGSQFYVEMEAK